MKNKILIIGDSCRDRFIYCDSKRLAPDVPVPILNILYQVENDGMAMNLFRNIEKYHGCDIITNDNWIDIHKTRYIHEESNHLFIRVDTPHNINPIRLDKISLNYDIVVISDYNKGFLSESDIRYICENHPLVFLDTKKILGDWAKSAKFIKINNTEYTASEKYIDQEISGKIIRTKGGSGAFYQGKNYPVEKVDVKDVSGAGDSFLAALVIKYLETNSIEESIVFANEMASKVVTKRGVTTI